MDNEQTNTPPAEEKPTAKRTAARKPRATKSTAKAAAAQESAPAAAAPTVEATPARKPRSTKSTAKSTAKTVVAQESDTKKTRKPRKKANDNEQGAAPVPAPASEPKQVSAQEPRHESEPAPEPRHEPKPAPAPEPKLREDREERAAEHINVPREQPHDNDSAPAPGFAVPETVGGNEGGNGGNNRRKRRRNRNRRGNEGQSPQPQAPQVRVDTDELVRRAWKIYLGEVTEEGLALMDDRTAAEASRRAFRVAELFLVEASRHRRNDRFQQTPAEDGDSSDKSSPEA